MKRKAKKATVIQAQPRLTNSVLKTLFFRAKYDGASAGFWIWACAMSSYGAARVSGERIEKSAPKTRRIGYAARTRLSVAVGR